jgi:hypothetical protein
MSNFVAVVVSIGWSKLASKSLAAVASGSSGLSFLVPGVVSQICQQPTHVRLPTVT